MAFELRPGQVTLQRNYKHKEGDNLPYYKGEMLYKGEKIAFVLWEKTTATGNTWYSGKVDEGRPEGNSRGYQREAGDEDDISFGR